MTLHHVVLSGCSGGGKSTLLAELARRGWTVVPEPGRRIVEAELRGDGGALPWTDLRAFAERALEVGASDRAGLEGGSRWVFFDRGLVDAAVALEHAGGPKASAVLERYPRYHRQVFLTPPWPEIYAVDDARRHGWDEAVAEHERLLVAFDRLDYEVILLPKETPGERADFVVQTLGGKS